MVPVAWANAGATKASSRLASRNKRGLLRFMGWGKPAGGYRWLSGVWGVRGPSARSSQVAQHTGAAPRRPPSFEGVRAYLRPTPPKGGAIRTRRRYAFGFPSCTPRADARAGASGFFVPPLPHVFRRRIFPPPHFAVRFPAPQPPGARPDRRRAVRRRRAARG